MALDLIAAPSPAFPALLQDDLDSATEFLANEKASSTRRAYRSDFRIFAAYCVARGVQSPARKRRHGYGLPFGRGDRRRESIHTRPAGGCDPVCSHVGPDGTAYKQGKRQGDDARHSSEHRRCQSSEGAGNSRSTSAHARFCPDTLKGKRDRALLALGFAGAFRRSELVALTIADVVEVPDGCRVMIRQSKTDQKGQGQEIAIPRGASLRPVEAVQNWIKAAGITEGPIFRSITKSEKVSDRGLSADSVADLMKACAALVGLDALTFSAHAFALASSRLAPRQARVF